MSGAGKITWLGHSTVLVELDGVRLLTDPVLRARVAHLRRYGPPPALPDALDAVLVSHAHHDHLDLPSLRLLTGRPRALVAPGTAALVRQALDGAVTELAPGAAAAVGRASIRAVPARHPGGRLGRLGAGEAVGFVIEGSQRVYYAGDTDLFAGMAELGPLDVALVPIWGWGPSVGAGHLDPERAARAVALLRPRVVVPIHWGTFGLLTERRPGPAVLRAPAKAFAAAVRRVAPHVQVTLAVPGTPVDLP